MTAPYHLLRVAEDVRLVSDINDDSWSPLGAPDDLRERFARAFPEARIESRDQGWIAVLRDADNDLVLEVSVDPSSAEVRDLPDPELPGRQRPHVTIVQQRVRAIASALGATAFDADARL